MSNPNIVPPLDPARSYIMCPSCELMGYPAVEMRIQNGVYRCPLQHEYDLHSVQKLVAQGREVHFVKSEVIERPSPNQVAKQFYIHPATYARLQEKFHGRFLSTMDTFFNILAEGNVLFILGDDATELKRRGFMNAKQIIAALDGMREMEETHDALIKKLAPLFSAAQNVSTEG